MLILVAQMRFVLILLADLIVSVGQDLLVTPSRDAWVSIPFTPSLHSHLGHSSRFLMRCERDEVRTNVDIHTLVQESSIMRQDIRDILVSSDSGLIYQHVSESFEMRREQVKSVEDETNVPFTLSFLSCLILSRWECNPGIRWILQPFLIELKLTQMLVTAPCEDVKCGPHAYCKANGAEAYCICEEGWTYKPGDVSAGCVGEFHKNNVFFLFGHLLT